MKSHDRESGSAENTSARHPKSQASFSSSAGSVHSDFFVGEEHEGSGDLEWTGTSSPMAAIELGPASQNTKGAAHKESQIITDSAQF